MIIEAVDFFYYAMPEVTDEVDGSQDALLVRVRAGEYEGWGECEAAPLPSIAAWCCPKSHGVCKPVRESVLGQPLRKPEDIYHINDRVRTNSLDLLQADHTLSGIDIALWDLLARSREIPVHTLLGCEKVYPKRPYASVLFGDTPEQTYAKAQQIRSKGFTAAKFGWNQFGLGTVEQDAAHVAAAREGLGDDALLMIDAGTVWQDRVEDAAARLETLHRHGVTWLEEPFVSHATLAYRALTQRKPQVPLAAGEGAHNFHMASALIDQGDVSYIQIDTGRIGGISTSRQVANYVRNRKTRYVNHTFTSSLSLAASLAPYWDLEHSTICEYPVEPKPLCAHLTKRALTPDPDGMLRPVEAPGLGVEPDLERIEPYRLDVEIRVGGRVLYASPDPLRD